ncbi:MAG: homocitrate synthase [Chloroflexi bacterium]|nr:homocitrate synthase [Chloroflexota bacterium]
MAKVYFIDVTNRDGVQASRISLSKFQKTMVNWYLARMGVRQSEAGFPFLSHERNYLQVNLELKEIGALGALIISGWCRAVVEDTRAAVALGMKDLNLSISTSDQMIRNKFRGRLDRTSIIKEAVQALTVAKEGGVRTLGINAEDASRTDMDYLVDFALAAKEAGAQRMRYCDTVGQDTPHSIEERIYELASLIKMPIELHCHDDLGLAVANSIAGAKGALDAGQDAWINTTVNGIGERAGQADLVSCVMAYRFGKGLEKYPLGDDIDLKLAWPIANYAAYAFKLPLSINQPGVGANAFAHESGIHADGALKNHANYELYDHAAVGREDRTIKEHVRVITTGEYSGLAGFKYVYEQLGIVFQDDEEARFILNVAQLVNSQTQLPLLEDELRFIARYPDQVAQLMAITSPRRTQKAPAGPANTRD